MFEDPSEDVDNLLLPPYPKVVVIDFALVSGMDSSAVDVFSDILAVCSSRKCKLFLSAISVEGRQTMALGGIKPETTQDRASRKLRFFPDLDSAVGKAEDVLFSEISDNDDMKVENSESGFCRALRFVDEQVRKTHSLCGLFLRLLFFFMHKLTESNAAWHGIL